MVSCDAHYISKLIPEITYNDVICSMGLSNGIFLMKYDEKDIYMMKSRYVTSQAQLLERLGISYKTMKLEELFQQEVDLEKVLVFLPKMLLDNIDSLHRETRQLALSMSSFRVRHSEPNSVILTGMEPDEREFEIEITKENMEKLSSFHMKPEMDSLLITRLDTVNCTKNRIKENIRESMEHCLDDYDGINNGELLWFGGTSAYRKLAHVIKNFDKLDEIAKKVFVGTMVSGSNFFYRKEYWEALSEYETLDAKEVNQIRVAGGLWRKVIRSLINHLCCGQRLNLVEIESVISKIESLELRFFSYIINTI